MHIIRSLLLVFLLLGMASHLSRARLIEADTGVIRVPNDFPTIQEAINAAENGSTILVNSGVYYEHVVINKTLTLLGASKDRSIGGGIRLYPQTPWTRAKDYYSFAVFILLKDP